MSNLNDEQQYETLTEALAFIFEQQIKGLYTCLPGVIVSYNAATKRAAIKPGLERVLTDGTQREMPIIQDVPVCFPTGGGFSLLFPVSADDTCILVFSQRGIENFKETFAVERPDEGLFELNDAIAIMGFGPLTVTPASGSGAALQADGGDDAIIVEDGLVRLKTGTQVVIDAPDTQINGNVNITGNLVNKGITFHTHNHAQGNDGNGDAEVDTNGPQDPSP